MAGIIIINDTQRWAVSNWVYWNVMDHVIVFLADNAKACSYIERSKWMQNLDLSMLKHEQNIFSDVVTALKTVAEVCADGKALCRVDGRVLDDLSQKQFRDATWDLASMLKLNEQNSQTLKRSQ